MTQLSKKAKSLITFFPVLVAIIICSGCIHLQQAPSEEKSLVMLKNFYTEYLNEVASSNPISLSAHKLDSLKNIYCTEALLIKIPNLIAQSDTDPFIKAQDSNRGNAKTLSVKKEARKENTYIVSYVDEYDKLTKAIHVTVIQEEGIIKISSIW